MANNPGASAVQPATAWGPALKDLWHWAWRAARPHRTRRLRVCESLSLGERRFVAVIEFNQELFLVGGSGNSLSLLARLKDGKVEALEGGKT